MKKMLLAGLGALISVAPGAIAGPNNGILALIQAEGVVYTTDIDNYCGASAIPPCEEAVSSYGGTDIVVLNTVAYFVGSPRLAGVIFGIEYPETDFFLADFGPCGDFELFTSDWPASGEGTAITFGAAQTTLATHLYWFAGYNYYGNAVSFDLTPHPTGGAVFADDDVPSNLDEVVALGSFGFGGLPGNVPCLVEDVVGACCDDRCGGCVVVTEEECGAGSSYLGDDTLCDPNPCAFEFGACCFDDGQCAELIPCECEDAGGVFQGDGVLCEDADCMVVPTIEASWGQLKSVYR